MARIIKNSFHVFLIICLFFCIFVSWIFSGRPQIFNFPPNIQEAQAAACANPTITLAGGAYTGIQTSTITAACNVICYTINGSTPTASSGACTGATLTYSGAVTINQTMSIKALAISSAKTASSVVTNSYTITVNTPTFGTNGGSFNNDTSSTILDAFTGATICYTTNGTTPAATTPGTCSTGATYSGAVSITATGTQIKAIGTKSGSTNSAVATSNAFTLTVADPTFGTNGGSFNNDTSTSFSSVTTGAVFCSTLDGSTPAAASSGTCSAGATGASATAIATGTTVKVLGTKANYVNSAVQTSNAFILTVGAITSSPGAGAYSSTQSVTLNIATTTGATPHYTIDGSAVSCSSTSYSGAISVPSTATIKAIGCKTNYVSSSAISDLYSIISLPTVTTQAASGVEATTATGNGNITNIGGENNDKEGFVYDTASHAKPGNVAPASSGYASSVENSAGGYSAGAYTKGLTSLSPGTTYYIRAYSHNTAGYSYANDPEITFLTKPAAPTSVSATDTLPDKVTITWTKSTGATDYHVWRSTTDLGSTGDVATFDDTGADAPTITAGTAGTSSATDKVGLSISGATSNYTSYNYKVVALNATGNSADSSTDAGHRASGSLAYQWYRSSGTGDSGYSTLSGATTASCDDTAAPAPTITAGSAVAGDATSTDFVPLSLSGQSANAGQSRYYYATVSATGASSQDTNHVSGNRSVGSLTYQWQRSASDSIGSVYSDIAGATGSTYNDTAAPADGSGRYYRCVMNATGAAQQTSATDRGYKAVISVSVDVSSTNYDIMFMNTTKSSPTVTATVGNTATKLLIQGGDATYSQAGKCGNGICTWALSDTVGQDNYVHAFATNTGLSSGSALGSNPSTNWVPLDRTGTQILSASVSAFGTQSFKLDMRTPSSAGTETDMGSQYSTDITILATAP